MCEGMGEGWMLCVCTCMQGSARECMGLLMGWLFVRIANS